MNELDGDIASRNADFAAGFDKLADQSDEEQRNAKDNEERTHLAMACQAQRRGGFTPASCMQAYRRQLGIPDGEAVDKVGAYYDMEGNCNIVLDGANGPRKARKFTPVELLQLDHKHPGIMSDDFRNQMMLNLGRKYTQDQIDGMLGFKAEHQTRDAVAEREAGKSSGNGVLVPRSWLGGGERRGISAFGANGKGGFTQYRSDAGTGFNLEQQDLGTRAPQQIVVQKGKYNSPWDDALKQQQLELKEQELENKRMAFDKQSAELDRYMQIKEQEDAERSNRQNAMNSAFGQMAILSHLQNGTVSKGQVEEFNKMLQAEGLADENGGFNYIGTKDKMTGKPFADGNLHFIRYKFDEKGNAVGIEQDEPMDPEFRRSALSSYLGNAKEILGGKGSGMTPERIQLEHKLEEGRQKRSEARVNASRGRDAASVAKTMTEVKRGLDLTPEQQAKLRSILKDSIFGAFGDEAEPSKAPSVGPGAVQKRAEGIETGGKYNYGSAKQDGEYFVRTLKDGRKYRIKKGANPNYLGNWEQF